MLPATCLHPHGGPDACGVPRWDFSTNTNACGPYAPAVVALQATDARNYPDPAYTTLVDQLAAWHGVAVSRILLGASGSELIQRLAIASALSGQRTVSVPVHAYGDYARAAQAAGLRQVDDPSHAALIWACEPSSPLGRAQASLADLVVGLRGGQVLVLDEAYAPLRLSGVASLDAHALDRVWRLISPNKALGLTGVRAAYIILPADVPDEMSSRMRALAPSWSVGAHGVALLSAWATADAHAWLASCRETLRHWKARQLACLSQAGWQLEPSDAHFFVGGSARWVGKEGQMKMQATLAALRDRGIKLRDTTSFGLPGQVRVSVGTPEAQDALLAALSDVDRGSP